MHKPNPKTHLIYRPGFMLADAKDIHSGRIREIFSEIPAQKNWRTSCNVENSNKTPPPLPGLSSS